MAGRPKNPNTDFKVALRVNGSYRYAATQPTVCDPDTGKSRRRYIIWGEVTDDFKFIPNERYKLSSKAERKKLIFPKDWNLSEIKNIDKKPKEIPVFNDPYITNDGSAFTGTVNTVASAEQFNNRLYGGPWFLWQIAVKKHVIEDLLRVFDDNQIIVKDVMTLAMYPILTKGNYNQTDKWQRYTKTPSDRALTASYITRLTQQIKDDHRMNLLKRRIKRQNDGAVVACDSTTRSAYGRCLADIRWGHNKDNEALRNTLEVVVYSLDTHEPIYYRTFGGNESDCRTLRTIISDLKALGCKNLTVIFDRGYETDENIINMIKDNQTFLVCGKTGQSPVIDCIYKIEYDENGMPVNMRYSRNHDIYYAQYKKEKTITNADGSTYEAVLNINLFLNMKDRISTLTAINEALLQENQIINKLVLSEVTPEKINELKKACPYHSFKYDKEKKIVISLNEKKIKKEKGKAGFFSSVSHDLNGDAIEQYELYLLRDEQEKYFEAMKDQLGFNMQQNWSEDGKTGRLFILFIGLILRSEIRSVWRQKLKKSYPSSVDVLHEMYPIRYCEYSNGSTHVTGFTTPQADICQAFKLPIPEDCLSSTQKAAIDRKQANRGRGRPKGSINKN